MDNLKVGSDIKITVTYRDLSGNYFEPDSASTVDVYDSEDTQLVTAGVMLKEADGIYYYWWDSSGQGKDIYTVVVSGKFGTHDVVERSYVELI